MKVLLVSVPLEFPLATYCLAAQLGAMSDTADVDVELLNLDAEKLNDYRRKNSEIWRYIARVEQARPQIIGFSVYLWSNLSVRELVEITALLYPDTAIVLGGPELASIYAVEPWMQHGRVTAAVRGEGELTFVEIVRRLRRGDALDGVLGCSWWTGTSVRHEGPRPPISDLSQLTSPYLSGWVTDGMFHRLNPDTEGVFPRAFLETYRGCYMQCSYCQWGNGSKSRFEFERDRVKQELSWIISRHVRQVWIVDAMFGFKKAVAKELLRHIINEKRHHGSKTSMVCYHNQDFYDPELFDLYREANVAVEVDLQSTGREVLSRAGRAKWYIDSFDRHRQAFQEHGVPTTGAADLIIGLPRDTYAGFCESVDFMLRRGMNVNLYQTSIIPATPMWTSVAEDGTVFSPLAPRAVFRNNTFPVRDMVKARLLGHGVDLFGRYPRTAALLFRHGFDRPLDLCIRLGELIWKRFEVMYGDTHTHDGVLSANEALVEKVLAELCVHEWQFPIARDLFRLEAAIGSLAHPPEHARRTILQGAPSPALTGVRWLEWRPRYRRDAVIEVRLDHRIDKVLSLWNRGGAIPEPEVWRSLERSPRIALVYAAAHDRIAYRFVDPDLMFALLLRFSGYFTVAECLDTFVRGWRHQELSALAQSLASLSEVGLIDTLKDSVSADLGVPDSPAASLAAL